MYYVSLQFEHKHVWVDPILHTRYLHPICYNVYVYKEIFSNGLPSLYENGAPYLSAFSASCEKNARKILQITELVAMFPQFDGPLIWYRLPLEHVHASNGRLAVDSARISSLFRFCRSPFREVATEPIRLTLLNHV